MTWNSQRTDAERLNDAIRTPGGDRLAIDAPLYHRVPKDLEENLRHRRKWLEIGSSSREAAETIWQFCKADPLWYWNTWCWTFDPRIKHGRTELPFITYPYQDQALLDIINAIRNGEDRLIEKSRDMGASWIVLYAFEYLWHFEDSMTTFRLVSRKEDLVDAPGDPDSLMWKLDFILKWQPRWLKPTFIRNSLHLANERTGSTIDGESTTSDAGRGGRSTADLYDEFASVPNADPVLASSADRTNCRIFASTPKGQANAFYRLRDRGEIKIIRFHWSQHPVKAKGLYASSNGKLQILDGEQLTDYPYILDGKLRSPWYDKECKRRTAMEVAQELDIDYLGSDYQFFDSAALDRISKTLVVSPFRRGELCFDPLSLRTKTAAFRDDPKGRFRLWTQLDQRGRIVGAESRSWVIAADVAMGTGASNSTISFGCREVPEKIGEIACPYSSPQDWAELSIALANWLKGDGDNDPEIIFEANGPGRLFGDKLQKRQYPRIFWRTKDGRPDAKQLEQAGWWSTTETKLALLGEYRNALVRGLFTIRSDRSIDEARLYVFRQGGTVEHAGAGGGIDPSGARENHGDQVIADSLLWYRVGKELEPIDRGEKSLVEGSFAARQRERQEKRKREQESLW